MSKPLDNGEKATKLIPSLSAVCNNPSSAILVASEYSDWIADTGYILWAEINVEGAISENPINLIFPFFFQF